VTRTQSSLLVVGLVAVFAAHDAPLSAHHGSAVSYDISKQVTLTGKVTEMVWSNPHVFIMFDVADEQNKVVNWGAETHPPAGMMRNRVNNVALPWSATTLKAGDVVTITLFPSRVGAPRGLLAKVVDANGKVLLDDGDVRNQRDRNQ
jgi:Family of unknown function (DUF6152)